MSIVTDALNRLQAERSRPAPNSESSTGPQSLPPPESGKPNFLAPQPPSKSIRNILRVSLIIVALASVGIGAYLWGLTLMPDVAKVSPEHDTGPVSLSEVNPPEKEALPQKDESISEPKSEDEARETVAVVETNASEESLPAETASVAESTPEATPVPTGRVAQAPATPTEPVQPPARGNEPVKVAKVTSDEPPPVRPPSANEIQPQDDKVPTKSLKPPKSRAPAATRYKTPFEIKLDQAQYLIKKQRYRQAVTVLQPLFITPPETWEPWFWMGTAKLGLGELNKAQESFIEGLARNAAVPQLWVQRALVSQQQGEFGEALESLRQAELIAPQLPEVQLNLAYSLEIRGNIALAVDHYQTFLALTEGDKPYQAARKKVLERIIRLEAT